MFTVQNETRLKVVTNSSTAFDGYIGSFNYRYDDLEVFEELPGDSYLDGDKVSFEAYYDKLIITEYEVRISAK